jgi:hypothetical protein
LDLLLVLADCPTCLKEWGLVASLKFYSISSMKKQSVSRTVISCAHNILIPNHLFSLLLISAASFAEKQHLSFLVIGLSREGPESTIYCRLIKLKLYGYSWIKYWIYISCCSKQRNGCNYMPQPLTKLCI